MVVARKKPKTPKTTATSDQVVSEEVDRISNLPETIIHYILSFVETIDVVRASAVSRKWRSLWFSMPYLNLDGSTFSSSGDYDSKKFRDFVKWVLISQNGSVDIKRFRLCIRWSSYSEDHTLDRWIGAVSRRNVQELQLKLSTPIKLPYSLLTCESLVTLKLIFERHCVLQLPTFAGFSKLKTLHLWEVQLLDNISFHNFILSCPVLENLNMRSIIFRDFKTLDISSTSLKYLTINNNYSTLVDYGGFSNCEVKVACQNLASFTFTAESVSDLSIEGPNSLRKVFVYLVSLRQRGTNEERCDVMCKLLKVICNIEVLILSNTLMEFLYLALAKPECFSTSFSTLKSLTLSVGMLDWNVQSIIKLLDCSPNLEALTIFSEAWKGSETSDSWKLTDKTISCLTNHLKAVEVHEANGNENELEFVRFLLKNGHVLQKMSISWVTKVSNLAKFITKVVNFPRSSANVELKFLEPTLGVGIYQCYRDSISKE